MHIAEEAQGGAMRFTTSRGGTVEIPFSEASVKTSGEQTFYIFTATVVAKEMTDTIVPA